MALLPAYHTFIPFGRTLGPGRPRIQCTLTSPPSLLLSQEDFEAQADPDDREQMALLGEMRSHLKKVWGGLNCLLRAGIGPLQGCLPIG